MFAFDIMRREFGIARGRGGKNTVGVATRGRMKKDLNDLSRFSYSHFPPFTARTHPHKHNGQCTKKRGEKKGGRPKRGSANRSRRVECHFLRFLTEEIADRTIVVACAGEKY